MKRKICIVTGTRAEYGLLSRLMKAIHNDYELNLQIIATGMHMSPEFGLTYQEIEQDGFVIDRKIEMLLSSDTAVGVTKSTGLGLIGFAEAFEELRPDVLVLLGDRFELLSAATAALIARIPIAHIHGGETTEGAFDEAIRHSITKMSHLHFTSTEDYRNRVIQLGEQPERVFNVGSLGIENIRKYKMLTREEFEHAIDFKLGQKSILLTYHPVTLENATAEGQFAGILKALDNFPSVRIIFTKANADTEGRAINQMIDNYVLEHPENAIGFTSLGQLRYLSAMKHVDVIIGNSSSGIIEAPSLDTPTVNIGDRQKGRVRAESVIDCRPATESIVSALNKAFSEEFGKSIRSFQNPYEKPNTSVKIKDTVKHFELSDIIKKKFYDMAW